MIEDDEVVEADEDETDHCLFDENKILCEHLIKTKTKDKKGNLRAQQEMMMYTTMLFTYFH